MIVAGVDVGRTGAVAFLDTATGEGWGELVDTSDGGRLMDAINNAATDGRIHAVGVEKVSSSPQMGVASAFKFGMSYGSALSVVACLGLPLLHISPRQWQALAFKNQPRPKSGTRHKGGANAATKARKMAVLKAARERWPMASLDRVKDGALADALWICLATAKEVQG